MSNGFAINEIEIYMSYHKFDEALIVCDQELESNPDDQEIISLRHKIIEAQKTNVQPVTMVVVEPKEDRLKSQVNFKERLIRRMIEVGRQCNLPGFVVEEARLISQFSNQNEASLLTLFELTIINAHRDGIQ